MWGCRTGSKEEACEKWCESRKATVPVIQRPRSEFWTQHSWSHEGHWTSGAQFSHKSSGGKLWKLYTSINTICKLHDEERQDLPFLPLSYLSQLNFASTFCNPLPSFLSSTLRLALAFQNVTITHRVLHHFPFPNLHLLCQNLPFLWEDGVWEKEKLWHRLHCERPC